MIAVVFAAVLFQDRPIEASIEAFLKGDAAARVELEKFGAYAIPRLLRARKKSPEKLGPLIYQVKKAAAYPQGGMGIQKLDTVVSFRFDSVGLEEALRRMGEHAGPSFWDQFNWAALKTAIITMESSNRPLYMAYDMFCDLTGLDYGFFHNSLVIGMPERLWPQEPPSRPSGLLGEELTRARRLIEKLGDDFIEVRETAARELMVMGAPVISILEAQMTCADAEIVARCSVILVRIRPVPSGVFGPSAAARQVGSSSEQDPALRLQEQRLSPMCADVSIGDLARLTAYRAHIRCDLRGGSDRRNLLFRCSGQSLFDQLSLATQTQGLDFMFDGGKLIIDTREAIEKLVSEGK